jgi:hypothetical protein
LRVTLRATATEREDDEARTEIERTTALLLAGTGVALGVVTLGHFLWNDGRHDDWASEDERLAQAWSGGSADRAALAERQAANDELLGSILRADAVTVGLAVGAGALVTAGAVLLLAGAWGDDPLLEPTVGPGALGLRCSRTF